MKNKFLYWGLGALVGGILAIMISVSLASPGIPNPGHLLSCTTVTCNGNNCTATCPADTTCTGGGCSATVRGDMRYNHPQGNGWFCNFVNGDNETITGFARCCAAE